VVVGSGGAAVPIVGAALETIEGYRPPPEVREDYLESYEGDRFVESLRYARAHPWVAGGYRAAAARGPAAAVMSPATDGGNDELEQ